MRGSTLGVGVFAAAVAALFSPALSAKPLELGTIGPQTFKARRLIIEDFAGTLTIDTYGKNGLDLTIVGDKAELEKIKVVNGRGRLRIMRKEPREKDDSWGRWFDWMRSEDKKFAKLPSLTVRVPEGTPVELRNVYARVAVGDTVGPIRISGRYVDGYVGNVSKANIELLGDGDLGIGKVDGEFDLKIYGSGKVEAGAVGPSSVKIAGSGDVTTGDVNGSLSVSISGKGDVRSGKVKGAATLAMDGDGDIRIGGGRAAPFKVAINGDGDVYFPGMAVDPDIKVHGRGDVTIGLYEGKLKTAGVDQVEVIGSVED